jgi:nucleoside-diphosphate kinase
MKEKTLSIIKPNGIKKNIVGKIIDRFESQGLKEIEVLGKDFDAASMEAVDTKEGELNKVLEVLQSGYELNGMVIRPAKVIVGANPSVRP